MRFNKWLAEIKRGGPREIIFELVRTVATSVWAWVGGPTLLTLILQQWSAYNWDVKFVALLLAATGGFVAWRHIYDWHPASAGDPGRVGEVAPSDRLATVSWQHGFKNHSIDHPWQLHSTIEYLQHAKDVSCYVRCGRLIHYMGGDSALEWSQQMTLSSSPTVHKGKVERHYLASIPPNEKQFEFFSEKLTGAQTHENSICIEVVIASSAETQRERRYYGLVLADRLVAVLIDQSRFAGAGDA